MPEPAPQRNLNRVWILILAVIVIVWIIYALTGGPSTPKTTSGFDSAQTQQR
jgi:hypothetical protein